ncbi:hypothetical protein F4V57_01770 [Acinetobacter qingfengensis]|uniref:Nucleoside phosphorylase domain-containing protein n=1 Tax=Acinetobacter qingfengensis TaxID=1262585 RepID=A0A1E7R914_9GAMM|nr:hypothetical protein [Acinetobacter qingfengensis]KAA8735547.1 hypothetical protein F4V57_01770 [Acinetobacter qingfengensis]OEY95806.1 hypothetical protein BJI46_02470 [Acinetobacter qingfengensis]
MNIKSLKNSIDNKYFLILTSNQRETDTINELFDNKCEITINSRVSGKIGLIKGKIVLHIKGGLGFTREGSIGRNANLILSNEFFPQPVLTILAGVCWGNPDLTQIGDILISNKTVNCNLQNASGIPYDQETIISNIENTNIIHKNTHNNVRLISQETKIEDPVIRDILTTKYAPIHGGEMEGLFLTNATNWLIIKVVTDYADQINRQTQEICVEKIQPVITSIINSTNIEESNCEEFSEVVNYLKGNSVKIDINQITANRIQIGLTRLYGEFINRNLKRYHCEDSRINNLNNILRSFILEICSNAISHGKADNIKIEFFGRKIKIIDDGENFNLNDLNSENSGGTRDFKSFQEYHDLISYTHIRAGVKNIHTFNLSKSIDDIKEIIVYCKINSEIFYQTQNNIEYDESCSAVYFDISDLYMTSLRYPFVMHLIEIMKNHNKIFFLKTLDDMHRNDIIENIESVLINEKTLLEQISSRLFYI